MILNAPVRFFYLFLIGLAVQGRAQTVARVESDSTSVETGNPFVLHLTVPGINPPDTLNLAPWRDYIGPENILSQKKWTRNGNVYACDLALIFFDADSINLAPLAISSPHADTAHTNPLSFVVYPTPSSDDLADMAPIKDISRERVVWTDYLSWGAAIVGVLAILGLLFWWYSRSANKKKARSRTIELAPHELALKKLELLLQKALWRHGAVKEHCAELTFILREYLEKRYGVPALESTSSGLLLLLKATDFPSELKPDLDNILSQADLAKFAKAIPPEEFYLYSMDFAQALVARTIPPPPEEEQAENQLSNQPDSIQS